CAVANRVTGAGATSRSRTSMALAVRALTTARLRAVAARETSRLAMTTLPLRIVVAHADANRTARSGVISTLTSPETPRGPNRLRCPRDSQITLEVTTAPASTASHG